VLYIVSTPIGNLSDITLRALEILKRSAYILCEDTRRSKILLEHYDIHKPLVSFHKFNEKSEEERILRDLEEGKEIALISDAGTPLLADPGSPLVQKLVEKGLPFTAIPGPCSLIQALVLSGFETSRFQHLGFLSKKASEEREELRKMLFYRGTSAAFVTPTHIKKTLEHLLELDQHCKVAIARELTKVYEECLRGTPQELLAHFEKKEPKGEMVLMLSSGTVKEEDTPLEDFIALLQESFGLSLKEAIKLAAKLRNEPKGKIYKQIHSG
jgi:16S rRNA (cytidine1402-2'-O)-methyltransferase